MSKPCSNARTLLLQFLVFKHLLSKATMYSIDQLRACCDRAEEYPVNGSLLGPNTNEYTLEALHTELGKRKQNLFWEDETKTGVHFWETASDQIAGSL
jgi:hypothetical protein